LRRGHEALSLGDFEHALTLFTSSASFDPTGQISRVAIADALAAWGWDHIGRRRYEEAVTVLRRGLNEIDDHPSALAGLGYAYGQLRRDDAALTTLLRAAEVDPSNSRVQQWLGDLYDRRNDLQNATAAYERAAALKPGDADLAVRAARLDRERERQGAFVQAATRHFTVQFDGRENRDLHRIALGILEAAYGEIGRAFRFFPADATTVILYSHQQFQDITRSPGWTGAIFDGKIRVPTDGYEARLDAFKRVLFHEYTHALIHAKLGVSIARIEDLPGPLVPVWLHEGLAQYFERSAGDPAAVPEPAFPGPGGKSLLLPLAALEGSFMALRGTDASVAYAQSRSIVRYLIERYGMDRMNRLLDRLATNQPFDAACRDTFSAPYDRIERAWRDAVLGDGL
jgi:tetratricopeptide (TPR) repeat protein